MINMDASLDSFHITSAFTNDLQGPGKIPLAWVCGGTVMSVFQWSAEKQRPLRSLLSFVLGRNKLTETDP